MPNWLLHLSYVLVVGVGFVAGSFISDLDHTFLFGNNCRLSDTLKDDAGCSPNGIVLHDPRIPLLFIAFGVGYLAHIVLDYVYWGGL